MENHGYCVTTPYRDKSQIGVFRENLGDIWAKCQNLPHSKAKNPHGYGLQHRAEHRIINPAFCEIAVTVTTTAPPHKGLFARCA